jgi:hypothetical protein
MLNNDNNSYIEHMIKQIEQCWLNVDLPLFFTGRFSCHRWNETNRAKLQHKLQPTNASEGSAWYQTGDFTSVTDNNGDIMAISDLVVVIKCY